MELHIEIIEVENEEDIKLQIMDCNSRANPELIAETVLSIQELNRYFGKKDVYYQNQLVGQIELQIQKWNQINNDYVKEFKQQTISYNNYQTSQSLQYQYP